MRFDSCLKLREGDCCAVIDFDKTSGVNDGDIIRTWERMFLDSWYFMVSSDGLIERCSIDNNRAYWNTV